MIKKSVPLLLALVLIIFFSGCAEPVAIDACVDSEPSGFVSGLIHGIIAPFTFILSLFVDNVSMYDVNNTGGWYDFGFVIGAGILFGGGKKAKKKC